MKVCGYEKISFEDIKYKKCVPEQNLINKNLNLSTIQLRTVRILNQMYIKRPIFIIVAFIKLRKGCKIPVVLNTVLP